MCGLLVPEGVKGAWKRRPARSFRCCPAGEAPVVTAPTDVLECCPKKCEGEDSEECSMVTGDGG